MKVNGINVRLSVVLVFVVIKSDQVHCAPPTAAVTDAQSGDPSIPPLIFPKDGNVYKLVENETALKILQSRAEAETEQPPDGGQNVQQQQLPPAQDGAVAAADDESISNNGTAKQSVAASQVGYDENEDTDDDYSTEDADDDDDDDVEEVQPEDPNREEGLEEQFGDKDQHYPLVIDNTMIEVSSAMRQEHIWVIMVGAIIVLAVAAYIGMVLYRNRLEHRYGMRQRLVTEDDYYTNNDI